MSQLRDAGIETLLAEDSGPFEEINRGWLTRLSAERPRVTVKLGVSLDGRISLRPDVRSDMTGPGGAAVSARLRNAVDAVLVGKRTVDVDDPALTVRGADGKNAEQQPLRVVLCDSAPPDADARVMSNSEAPTLLLVPFGSAPLGTLPSHVRVDEYAPAQGVLGALKALGDRGINDVLVEPGSRLFSALWAAEVIDELVMVTAGGVAGSGGLSFSADGDAAHESHSLERRLEPVEAGIVGDVSVAVWRPVSQAQSQLKGT